MMEDDGHIFICDVPPGATYVPTVPGPISQENAERLRAAWFAMAETPPRLIILEEGATIRPLRETPQWPDAEFCAA